MQTREVHEEELAATCLCAPAIPLYPSTTFAVHRTYFGPRRIETEAALTDHFNCKLSCVVLLCGLPSHNMYFVSLKILTWYYNDIFSVKWKGCTKSMQKCDTSSWLLCDQRTSFEMKVFCSPWRSERNCGGRSLWILRNGGIIDQRR
jgi:hypothetical protein